jgi:hypothetical protein
LDGISPSAVVRQEVNTLSFDNADLKSPEVVGKLIDTAIAISLLPKKQFEAAIGAIKLADIGKNALSRLMPKLKLDKLFSKKIESFDPQTALDAALALAKTVSEKEVEPPTEEEAKSATEEPAEKEPAPRKIGPNEA